MRTSGGYLLILAVVALAAPVARAEIRINEVYANPPGDEDLVNKIEFIELISTTGGIESLGGLTLLLIDSNGANTGDIDEAWNLTSFSTGTNGLLLIGNNFDDVPLGGDFSGLVDPATTFGDPGSDAPIFSGMGNADMDNDALTLLLVSNFTGEVDQDLDPGNDGVLDTTPWNSIIDSLGWLDNNAGVLEGTIYTSVDLSQGGAGGFTPDDAARINGNLTANSAAAWYGGEIDGEGIATAFQSGDVFNLPAPDAEMTPGSTNFIVPEPASLALLTVGLGLMLARRRS